MNSDDIDGKLILRVTEAALAEDQAGRDITTAALIPWATQEGRALIIAKASGILAGMMMAKEAFYCVEPLTLWEPKLSDGDRIGAGDVVAAVEGGLYAILPAERVALNFLSHLSGIATAANAVVQALEGTNCRLRDTRKTTPGLRALDKYAVRVGGGVNHRMDLADGVLIKDNHIAALRARGLGIADGVTLSSEANPGMRIEVEVTNLDEAREGLAAGADELLLDNMTLDAMREVVSLRSNAQGTGSKVALEASGGITLENARSVAETGVDYISMGAITHSAPGLDMSLEITSD